MSAERRVCSGGATADATRQGVQLMVTVGGLPTQSAVDQVLSTTRNVRRGLDPTREVPRELIEDCLRVAMQAPIGSNGLYPHFIVVTDPAKRTALAGIYKRAWDAYLPLPFSAANLRSRSSRTGTAGNRGFASTELPDDRHHVHSSMMVADQIALHEVLGGDADAVLIAHDWGAVGAWGAAGKEPERWRRCIVLDFLTA